MTSFSGPNQYSKLSKPSPNWDWLRDRIHSKCSKSKSANLDAWLAEQLEQLESEYAHLITRRSRLASLRKDIGRDAVRGG